MFVMFVQEFVNVNVSFQSFMVSSKNNFASIIMVYLFKINVFL